MKPFNVTPGPDGGRWSTATRVALGVLVAAAAALLLLEHRAHLLGNWPLLLVLLVCLGAHRMMHRDPGPGGSHGH